MAYNAHFWYKQMDLNLQIHIMHRHKNEMLKFKKINKRLEISTLIKIAGTVKNVWDM